MREKVAESYREWCRSQLGSLSPRHWAAFAASSAERQFGTYTYVSKEESRLNPQVLRKAIDRGWAYAMGEEIALADLENLQGQVVLLIPDLDESDIAYASLILDASAAVSYLLAVCLEGRMENAAWAGGCARNAVDEWVQGIILAGPDSLLSIRPEEQNVVQKRIDAHPLMMREMQHQRSEMAHLRGHRIFGPQECVQLRQLWSNGAKSNLDLE